ncbi:heat shock protein 70 family [Umbelopsis sp. AD052]|nr:heat shock protein 70 family [Umbelopsis sp. AD052]
MSIDYGTEWFKVGLIKPGIPLDIALNKDSKRKTQAVVSIRGNERMYGGDAVNLAGRFPQATYFNLKSLAGRLYDDPHCAEYRNRFVNNMIKDPIRGTPLFQHDHNTTFTVEELIAFQFQNAKEQASANANEAVKDVVITVTPFATQFERQAILDAAELAGLNVLALMHDETAVALNYAISRKFTSTPEYHIFYDMGAGSTVASLVSFSNVEVTEGKRNKTYPQIEVKAVGYDATLGGHEFDVRLQKFLADGFMTQKKSIVESSIFQSERAMTRLLKEANRVKQILSANTETMASVEGLHEEQDFKMKVTRSELENLCKDLLARVDTPIKTVLEAAKMKTSDVNSLVLVGGSVRVPSVQKILKKTIGSEKVAQNVNADEAAVLGAAFRGASISNQFRLTQEIKIKDVTTLPIQIIKDSENSDGKQSRTTLFNEYGTMGIRKIVQMKKQSDFEFDLVYGKTLTEEDKKLGLDHISTVKVSGLTQALKNHKADPANADDEPKVKVSIELSDSGILSVTDASVSITSDKPATIADKVKSFFGSKDNKESTEDEKLKEPENQTKKSEKVNLQVDWIPRGFSPLSPEQKKMASARITTFDESDAKRKAREESRNHLEAFVYRIQDFLYDDTVELVSTEEDRENLREHLSAASDWLYEEGENADTPAYVERLRKLQLLERPITYRRSEHLKRDEHLSLLDKGIEAAQLFIETILNMNETDRYHSEEELTNATTVVDEVKEWKTNKLGEQKALEPHVDPVLTTREIQKKMKDVEAALRKLTTKKKPKVTKKKETNKKNETQEEAKKDEESKNEQPSSENPVEDVHDEL